MAFNLPSIFNDPVKMANKVQSLGVAPQPTGARGNKLFDWNEWQQGDGGLYRNSYTGQTSDYKGLQSFEHRANMLSSGTKWSQMPDDGFLNWEDSGLGAQWGGRADEIGKLDVAGQRDILEKLAFTPSTSHGGWQGMSNGQRLLLLGGIAAGGMGLAGVFGGAGAAGAGSGVMAAAPATTGAAGIAAGAPLGSALMAGTGVGAGGAAAAGGGLLAGIGGKLGAFASGPWGETAIKGGLGLIGNIMQRDAAKDGVEAQTRANESALAFARETRDMTMQQQQPFIDAARGAVGGMTDMAGLTNGGYDWKQDPGYQFRIGEGMKALENSASARGGLMSGGFARKALQYATDYSSAEYTKVYDRLASIAGLGQSSGSIVANANGQLGGTGAALMNATGQANAGGYAARGNANADLLNQIAESLGGIDWKKIGKG